MDLELLVNTAAHATHLAGVGKFVEGDSELVDGLRRVEVLLEQEAPWAPWAPELAERYRRALSDYRRT